VQADAPVPSVPPFTPDGVLASPLLPGREPSRLVVIRLHAFGDTAITFPLLAALKRERPGLVLDVVTDVRSRALFEAHRDVHGVYAFETRQPRVAKGLALLRTAAAVRRSPVPAVLDLQRNRWSRLLTRLLLPGAWAAFDRHAPKSALTRYRDAAESLGLPRAEPVLAPHARPGLVARARERLAEAGWDGRSPLVCLNPAGGWPTKQWPLDRWVALGRRLEVAGCRLLALTASPVPPRFSDLGAALRPGLLDLAGRTEPGEALALVSLASLAVSEDSGLMHLAWVQGVPTIALFGSSRAAWSRPEGPRASGFYSEDLACGACMRPDCARGDLLCLDRVRVDDVLQRAVAVLALPPGGETARTSTAP
jgi:ADP-heptose:LPS heptosyltransferase